MALSSIFTYGSLRSYKFSWEKTAASAPANVWEVENAVSWGTERELCGISWSCLNPYVRCMNMIYSLKIVCTSFRPGIG